jgi:endonuclease YncB( thermonuclease family)
MPLLYDDADEPRGVTLTTARYRYDRAQVVRVTDGDTAWFQVDVGFYQTYTAPFRLYGVNAPEVVGAEKARGLEAKAFLAQLLPVGKVVKLWTYAGDKYGRWLARVFADGKDVGLALVDAGHATLDPNVKPELEA